MARITIEDCVSKVTSHFELVILAAKRARQISNGAKVEYDNDFITKEDKPGIIALREVALGKQFPESLKKDVIAGYRRVSEIEEAEDFEEDIEFDSFDDPDMIASQANIKEEMAEDNLSMLDEIADSADMIIEDK